MICCDRCKQEIVGARPPDPDGMTAGYYVGWKEQMDPGEHIICDACMWADPRYIAIYGKVQVQ
jgi:hypothetical protein